MVMGVVGTVVDMPSCSVGGMAHVISGVRPPCIGSLVPRLRLGRSVDCARGRGSVVAEIAPEAKGSGETEIAPEAKGLGETEIVPKAKGSSKRPRPRGRALLLFFLPLFVLLIWVSWFMVPNRCHG